MKRFSSTPGFLLSAPEKVINIPTVPESIDAPGRYITVGHRSWPVFSLDEKSALPLAQL